MSYAQLDGRLPVVLLPVRLETRYFEVGNALELRIRIYPDAVHVAPPAFIATADEVALAEVYWRAHYAAGATDPQTTTARTRLETMLGDARARAVLRHTRPSVVGGALVFPQLPTSDDDAATSRVLAMPDRFDVIGFAGTTRLFSITGAPIPLELHVSPLGSLDPASRWQAHFESAEAVGLGVRVSLDRTRAGQLTRIFALGVRGAEASEESARVLGDLVERHAEHHGASFLAPGTPTNHARGVPPGGTPAPAPDGVLPAGCDGDRVATAIGVETGAFESVRGAAMTSDAGARAMLTATWPATWGYFLEQVLAPAVPAGTIEAARRLYLAHVRASGPYPTLALGRQPYGVLPVTSLARWRTRDGGEDRFVTALRNLLPRWIASGRGAPALAEATDAHDALVDIHAMESTSTRWLVRTVADVNIAGPWWLDDRVDVPDGLLEHVRAELASVGITTPLRAFNIVFGDVSNDIDLPLVAARRRPGFPGGGTGYVRGIAEVATAQDLVDHRVDGASPRTLLYYLLRHATLLVFRSIAIDVVVATDVLDAPVREGPSSRFDDLMSRTLPTLDERPIGDVLARRVPDTSIFSPLRAHRAALTALASLPAQELHRLTAETLDLASHRLDAWITAVATRRLDEQRQLQRDGANLGAYGWVDAPAVPAVPARDGATLAPRPGSHGFVTAPSLSHARTAAVLRAGFVASAGPDLAIDLSSQRVRAAREILDGMRGGRSLGALLGSRVERSLVDHQIGEQIDLLREAHPLTRSSTGERFGLDGVALHDAWTATPPVGVLGEVARELAETVDAISDLLLAELVHQHVAGNTARAAAVLDAIETGTSPPPQPDVVDTSGTAARTGIRIVWSALHAGTPWPSAARSARALAQPGLDQAATFVLGDPAAADALVRGRRGDTVVEQRVSLVELDLSALDVVALARRELAGSPLARLFERVLGDARDVTVTPNPRLRELCLVAASLRDCLATARGLGDTPTTSELSSWQSRIVRAQQQIDADLAATDAASSARLAALGGDVAALRARMATMTPADAIALLSGVPPETGVAWPHAALPEWDAARWVAERARVRPVVDAFDVIDVAVRARGARFAAAAFATQPDQYTIVLGPSASAQAGWIIDTWNESTPSQNVTAAIALHHDQPNARAPQAILLAVPPDLSSAWSLDTLLDTLLETIDLSFARQATPNEVWGPLLPAVYLADALDRDTPSTPLGDHAVVVDWEVNS